MIVPLVLALVAVLATTRDGQTQGPDRVTVQLKWVTQVQFAGYYAAKAKGFYSAEKLDVTPSSSA